MEKNGQLELATKVKENSAPVLDLRAILGADPQKVVKERHGLSVPIDYLQADLDAVFGAGNWWVENQIVIGFGTVGYSMEWNQELGRKVENKDKPLIGFNVSIDLVVDMAEYGRGVRRYVGTYGGFCTRGNIATATAMTQGMAFKNAAVKIGKRFGRSLNRNHTETYTSDYLLDALNPEAQIADAKSEEELVSFYGKFDSVSKEKLKPQFTAKKQELRAAQKTKEADPEFPTV